jgi:hypothetical protein
MYRAISTIVLSLCLSGCIGKMIEQKAPVTAADQICKIERYAIDLEFPGMAINANDLGDVKSLNDEVTKSLTTRPGDLLFLSGGSQQGAFGAGFLDGWHLRDGKLPNFQVVTGVSTGALQATGAFIGRPDIPVNGYTIRDESEILKGYVAGASMEGSMPIGAAMTALRRGSIADLEPLRARLKNLYGEAELRAVALRSVREGALLLAGATDVSSGRAIAFDLTDLAERYVTEVKAGNSVKADLLHNCYISALIASSVVPPGAQPEFIDNRMYIDGGAKFAVFAEDIGEIIKDDVPPPPPPTIIGGPTPPTASPTPRKLKNVYIILNSAGELQAQCSKANPEHCRQGSDTHLAGAHKSWTVPSLAGRTLSILTNQVERLSIDRAANLPRTGYVDPKFIKIDPDARDAFVSDLNGAFEEGARSCKDWLALDDLASPLEFHPRYMRCLLDFGRDLGLRQQWN